MSNEKQCPFMNRWILESSGNASVGNTQDNNERCKEKRCALWIDGMRSTEGIEQPGMCALVAMALKNQDGKIAV